MASAKNTKAASAAPDAPEIVWVRVRLLTPVRHDGADYAQAQEVELNAEAAGTLVQQGLAELA
jgi:hypothetical protein